MQKGPKSIIIGAILMILLGLARGFGGISLLFQSKEEFSNGVADDATLTVLAIFLILIGLFEIISATGILLLKRLFWIAGIVVTIAFVIDGAINGYFLFGSPRIQGQIINITIAVVIISCLYFGRKAFSRNS